jgi:hypothetical protein
MSVKRRFADQPATGDLHEKPAAPAGNIRKLLLQAASVKTQFRHRSSIKIMSLYLNWAKRH